MWVFVTSTRIIIKKKSSTFAGPFYLSLRYTSLFVSRFKHKHYIFDIRIGYNPVHFILLVNFYSPNK